ncbi:MAG: Dipeptide transport ATP-binding protein DppD [Chlamydiae bacterium]|nr:Dipeptide transport ATP-binding protein DppD [Chlamydiota bacterium]
MKNIIEIENLSIRIPPHKRLFSRVSLSVEKGQSVALMGPSGSGKTTFALSLLGLLSSKVLIDGRVEVLGINWNFLSEKQKDCIRGKEVSMIFQDPSLSLNPFFKIGFQFKEILARHTKLSNFEVQNKIESGLKEVGLENCSGYLNAYPHQLSGGEKQRVMIAMALLCDPMLLIADEPTAALDLIIKVEILKLISSIQKKRGLSLFLITHNPLIAQKMADVIYFLDEGKLHPQI